MAEEDWIHDGDKWINTENGAKVEGVSEQEEVRIHDKRRRTWEKIRSKMFEDDSN